MAGYVKKGPAKKTKKRKKYGTLAASFIVRGHKARARRTVLPI